MTVREEMINKYYHLILLPSPKPLRNPLFSSPILSRSSPNPTTTISANLPPPMATEVQNLTAVNTTNNDTEDNPDNKTLDPTVSASSAKPDRVNDSSTTVDSGSEGSKKDGDATKDSASLPVNSAAPVSDTEKKIRRAERFGITVQLSEEEKRNSRAERFGTAPSPTQGSAGSKKAEELKRKARAERFGIAAAPVGADEEAKKKARLERFGSIPKTDSQEEDKRKARAIRFSEPALNGKGDIEPKAAIAGKAGGSS